TFAVMLPSGGAQPTLAEAPDGGADAGQLAQRRGLLSGLRILVVEDETDTLEFLRRFLESCGAFVVAARSATEALQQLPGSGVGFLVSDIGLPDVDGYELLQRIRAMDMGAAGMPAIALTAYARREDR